MKRLGDICGYLQEVAANINSMPLDEVVTLGRKLWKITSACQRAVEGVKDRVRKETPATPGRHEFRGADQAVCTVTVPEPYPVLRSGVTWGDLVELLGPQMANELFVVKTTVKPRKDFAEVAARLLAEDPRRAQVLLSTVDMSTGKPRVSFGGPP